MKTILICAALPWELKTIKKEIKNHVFKDIVIEYLVLWVWNIATIMQLTQRLEASQVEFVVNIWVCWYKDDKQSLIQVARSVYAPTNKEIICPVFFKFASLQSIYCSETPIDQASHLWEELFVDMESYAVEYVCESYKIPRLILKVPIDKVWAETNNFDISKALSLLGKNIDYADLIERCHMHISNLKPKININKYLDYYKFTFSEKIILEKYIHKYSSLSQDDFDDFFEYNKQKEKKLFLQHLHHTLDSLSQI